ncbi:MAG: hypothetical protein HRU25_14860 [Psychrobium sp.]|nr:hypothetical protein [Psychrobium sp.]
MPQQPPANPRKGWKAGDLRGILEIIQPIDSRLSQGNHVFIEMVTLLTALLLFGFLLFLRIIRKLEDKNQQQRILNNKLSIEVEQRKGSEESTLLAKKQAELAKDEADTANNDKSVFLANISHEIRTPMDAILAYTQFFQRDSTMTKSQHESLTIV